jgi:hypothetical protein
MVPRTRSVETVPECTTRTPEMLHTYGHVAVTAQHQVHGELAQDRHHIAGVTEVVDITTGARDRQDVMMDATIRGPSVQPRSSASSQP